MSFSRFVFFIFSVNAIFNTYAFEVKSIHFEGLQHISQATALTHLPIAAGSELDEEQSGSAIQALLDTGFFKDVRLENKNGTLVVHVIEQPLIAKIEFSGIKEMNLTQLRKAWSNEGLTEARHYNRALLNRAEQDLKQQYLAKGYYAATVQTTLTPVGKDRVSILVKVHEGRAAKIGKLDITGNHVFSTKVLRNEMQLGTSGLFSWYTKNDRYSKQKLVADLDALKSFYMDRGFLDFRINSTQVSITPDKQTIALTIDIHEGKRFTVSAIDVTGKLLGQDKLLQQKLLLKPKDTFSYTLLTQSITALTDTVGQYGYAFAKIEPDLQIDRNKHEVALDLVLDPGKPVFVRRILITGNYRTRDEVVRRELRQNESSVYNAELIKMSYERLRRTDFFENVNITPERIPGSPDQIDLVVHVTEKHTGVFLIKGGYSTTEKFSFGVDLKQDNIFGTGTSLSLGVNRSHVDRTFYLAHYQPFATIDGVSRNFEIYARNSRPQYYVPSQDEQTKGDDRTLGKQSYKNRVFGMGVKYGFPVTEEDRILVGIGYERNHIDFSGILPTDTTQSLKNFIKTFGQKVDEVPLTIGWSRDNRDSIVVPTRGHYQEVSFKFTLPTNTLKYYQASYQYQYYRPIKQHFVLALNAQISYGSGYGGLPFPAIKNDYLGGIGSVRGYEGNSLGPYELVGEGKVKRRIPIGGASKLIGNAELYFPIPGVVNNRTVRMFGFFDMGALYPEKKMFQSGAMRYSTGLGFTWISPIGPLKFSYGFPIGRKAEDLVERFQFQFGTMF